MMHQRGLLRILGRQLNDLMHGAGLTQTDVARQMRCSTATVSRWLSGRRMSWTDFQAFAALVRLSDADRIAIGNLWDQTINTTPTLHGWRKFLGPEREEYFEALGVADLVEIFSAHLIPEVLRVPRYHEACVRHLVRYEREEWLKFLPILQQTPNPARRLHVVLDEAVFWRRVNGFDEQMDALLAAHAAGHVIQVLSFDSSVLWVHLPSFTIFSWADEQQQEYVQTSPGDMIWMPPGDLRRRIQYGWDHVVDQASSPEQLPTIIELARRNTEERGRVTSIVPLAD